MIWNFIAKNLARPAITNWLIKRAMARPYAPIFNNGVLYMSRFWLFNPYGPEKKGLMSYLPSIRLHHIVKEDDARHHHDHPWDARTVILKGWYKETRLDKFQNSQHPHTQLTTQHYRLPGDTAKIGFGEYHTITSVSPGGVWTLFITGKYRGTWGFLVNGAKVHYKKYLLDKP